MYKSTTAHIKNESARHNDRLYHFMKKRIQSVTKIIPLTSGIDLVRKNLLANCFRNFSKKRFKENCYQKSIEEIANFAKIAKVTGTFLAM